MNLANLLGNVAFGVGCVFLTIFTVAFAISIVVVVYNVTTGN